MTLAQKITLNASALAAARMLATVLGILSVGISTRYLGVDAFGALATALAFSSVLGLVADAGLWTMATREISKRPEDTQRIFATTLTLGLALSLVAAAVGLGFALLVYGGEGDALTREGILLMLIAVPLSAPFGAVNAYFVAQQQAWVGSLTMVTFSIVQVAGVALAAGLDWGFTGVAAAYLAGPLSQAALILSLAVGRLRLRLSWDYAMSRQLLRFALPLSGATIVHSLYWRIDLLLLSVLASDRQVGFYGLAYRVVDALVVLPGFVMITLLPEFSRLADDRERVQEIAEKAMTVMQVGALATLSIFAGFAREIVEVVGGPGFGDVEPILQILLVGVALTYASAVLAQVLVAVGREVRLLKMTLTLLPFNIALNIILIPAWGALGAAVAFAVSEALHLLLLSRIYRGYSQLPRPRRPLQVLTAAGLVGLIASAKYAPFAEDASPTVVLLVGVPLTIAVYMSALYTLRAMPSEVHTHLLTPIWRFIGLPHGWPRLREQRPEVLAQAERNATAAQGDDRTPKARLQRRLGDCLTAADGLRAGLSRGDLPLDLAQQVITEWANAVCRVLYEEDANHLTAHFNDESGWRRLPYRELPKEDTETFTTVTNALDAKIQRLEEVIAMLPQDCVGDQKHPQPGSPSRR